MIKLCEAFIKPDSTSFQCKLQSTKAPTMMKAQGLTTQESTYLPDHRVCHMAMCSMFHVGITVTI